jgi:hypothetical protein
MVTPNERDFFDSQLDRVFEVMQREDLMKAPHRILIPRIRIIVPVYLRILERQETIGRAVAVSDMFVYVINLSTFDALAIKTAGHKRILLS